MAKKKAQKSQTEVKATSEPTPKDDPIRYARLYLGTKEVDFGIGFEINRYIDVNTHVHKSSKVEAISVNEQGALVIDASNGRVIEFHGDFAVEY